MRVIGRMRPDFAGGLALALVIAALPGLLLPERWLPLALFGAGVVFAVITAWLWWREKRERQRVEQSRDLLDRTAAVGEEIISLRRGPTLEAWRLDAEALVSAAVGEELAARAVGPPSPAVVSDLNPMEVLAGFPFGGEYIGNVRMLAGELDELTLPPGFKPQTWSPFDFRAWEAEHGRAIEWEPQAGGPCPWCGNRVYPSTSVCARCGARIGGDFAFK
jgi:hypothetical protein